MGKALITITDFIHRGTLSGGLKENSSVLTFDFVVYKPHQTERYDTTDDHNAKHHLKL